MPYIELCSIAAHSATQSDCRKASTSPDAVYEPIRFADSRPARVFPRVSFGMTLNNVTAVNVISASAKALGFGQLKTEQAAAISQFVSGKDVFVALPTGYGKSLCYCCLPYVYDRLRSVEKQSIVVVVSPLVALMKDQGGLVSLAMQLAARDLFAPALPVTSSGS